MHSNQARASYCDMVDEDHVINGNHTHIHENSINWLEGLKLRKNMQICR